MHCARNAGRSHGCGTGKKPEELGRCVLSFRRNDAARFPLERTKTNYPLEKALKDVGVQAISEFLHPGKRGMMR